METFELILFLLAAVIASSVLDKFLPPLSLPLVQIALGAVLALAVPTQLEWGIDPELLLILFIAPLHFNESRHVDSGALWKNRWGIASLSVGLVFAIVIACGATLHALLPAVPLAAACALGGAMGSTDAVAVTALTHDRRFGRRHEALLKGEALFNDVTGTVVFQCCLTLLATGSFSLLHAGEEFALDLFGGFFGGLVMGLLAWGLLQVLRRTGLDNPTLHVMLELLLPFVIYLAAKSLHIGAVIAVVASGLMLSLLPQRHTAATARTKLQAQSVWTTLEFVLNGIIFVVLGMQLPRLLEPAAEGSLGDPATLLGVVVVLTLVLEAVRFAWLLAMDIRAAVAQGKGARSCFAPEALRGTLAMALAGAKGGITLSLMLTLTAGAALSAAGRATLVSIASGMIVLTLVLADFAVPALAPSKYSARRTRARVDAEIDLMLDVIASVEADASFTGAVKDASGSAEDSREAEAGDAANGGNSASGEGAPPLIDEPATVIVMHRYAEILEELAPAASPVAAARARAEVARVGSLYDQLDDIARRAAQWDESEDGVEEEAPDDRTVRPRRSRRERLNADRPGARGPAAPNLSDQFRQMRETHDAVEDVQAQALVRELQLIKAMVADGSIDAAHAKDLRNDVYIQQLVLD
ncbi:cation:proton antiporter [Adlercreutzia sp.]|uniref:cation:proton antiporter n=1 Tax=Adlercreutzia sp. TaxID=1872387 RepID=UPI003AEFC282